MVNLQINHFLINFMIRKKIVQYVMVNFIFIIKCLYLMVILLSVAILLSNITILKTHNYILISLINND